MEPSQRLSICVIDDDRIYQFAARKTIEATGLADSVMVFPNGEEAIEYLRENGAEPKSLPDVIFLDINMPIMNGWQFLEAYRPLSPTLRKPVHIYVVSSSVNDYDINRSKEYDTVSDYIIKPVHTEKFRQLLASLRA